MSPPQTGQDRIPLRLAGEGPPARADAARNRARLLEAAAGLVTEHGAAHLTMDAVAAAAGVGKGTVFRRFGDRVGLLLALLDHTERAYQESFLHGPPPLGPGAPATERLIAFGETTLDYLVLHRELNLAAEHDHTRRFLTPPRKVRATHVSMLLHEIGAGGDIELLTEALLGFLDIALVSHLTTQRDMPVERLTSGWRDLVARVVRPAG
ncbi:TetR/AcrR family transcriptional regulator [Saccharomonospora sp. NPDC006951]